MPSYTPTNWVTDVTWVDATAMNNLEQGVDRASVRVVTALPTTGLYEGYEVHYQSAAMLTDGIKWHLVYRSAAPTYKWEFIGGSTWAAPEIATNQTTASTTYVDLATVGPTLNAPLAGEYDIEIGSTASTAAVSTNGAVMSYSNGATAAADNPSAFLQATSAVANSGSISRRSRVTVAAAGDALTAKYRISGGAGTVGFQRRWLTIVPVRVI